MEEEMTDWYWRSSKKKKKEEVEGWWSRQVVSNTLDQVYQPV